MNILYILQQSIYNNEGKWVSADSNVNMCLDCVSEMYKIDPTIHFYILISPIHTFADIKSYTELYNKANVTFVEYPFIVNAFMNRYSFDPQTFIDMYKKLPHIDIVWNNICELTRNIRTTISTIIKNHPLYITANYWLDAPCIGQEKVDVSISYDWRQFDGFECSDICVFTCESTMRAWEKNAYSKFNKKYIEGILRKSVIWDFGYKISNFKKEIHTKFEIPTILFLNRLSGINYTHHEQFINAVNSLYEKRQDFQVIMTNPSMKVSSEELKKLVKPLKNIEYPISRDDYFTLLQSSHISCNLFTKELYGRVRTQRGNPSWINYRNT